MCSNFLYVIESPLKLILNCWGTASVTLGNIEIYSFITFALEYCSFLLFEVPPIWRETGENISIHTKCHCWSYYLLQKLKYVRAVLKLFIMTSGSSLFAFCILRLFTWLTKDPCWTLNLHICMICPPVPFQPHLRFIVSFALCLHWCAALTWCDQLRVRSVFRLCFQL